MIYLCKWKHRKFQSSVNSASAYSFRGVLHFSKCYDLKENILKFKPGRVVFFRLKIEYFNILTLLTFWTNKLLSSVLTLELYSFSNFRSRLILSSIFIGRKLNRSESRIQNCKNVHWNRFSGEHISNHGSIMYR